MNRRRFLQQTGAAGLTLVQALPGAVPNVAIVSDPRDPVASAGPSAWAVREFQTALNGRGIASKLYPRVGDVPAGDRLVVVSGKDSAPARDLLSAARATLPDGPE